jgi:hypothetical protein
MAGRFCWRQGQAASPAWWARSSREASQARVPAAGRDWQAGVGELGEAGDQEPLGEPGEEQGLTDADCGDLIAEAVRDAADEAVDAQPPEVVTAGAGNFPLIWHDATGAACRPCPAADQPSPAS